MGIQLAQWDKYLEESNTSASVFSSTLEQIGTRLVVMANRAIANGLKSMWKEAVAYSTSYYDNLNEIRIVTMKSQSEADALDARYRKNARDLKVTSTEYVKGAASLYRQGLNDQDVEGRLKQITIAAKTWGLTVKDSTDIMTVAVNNFNDGIESSADTAQRVADVYSYIGDAAATGADEIGIAMRKTAGSAGLVN